MAIDRQLAAQLAAGDLAAVAIAVGVSGDALLFARDGNGRTPLALAAAGGHTALVRFLLDHRADADATDASGSTALTLAVAGGHVDAVRALLERGAAANPAREPPLVWAARGGGREIVELLLAHGANVDARDHLGRGPLYWAAYFGHLAIVELLLDRGAPIDAVDVRGNTALHGAAENITDHEVAHRLIARGAKVDAVNQAGATPLDVAQLEGQNELMAEMARWAQAGAAG